MSFFPLLNKNLLFAIFSTCLVGAFHHGYHMTLFNIPHNALKEWLAEVRDNQIEYATLSWSLTSSMFPLGAFLGSLFTNIKFGPRKVLFYISFLTLTGQCFMNMSKEVDSMVMLNTGRFVVGVSAGVCSGIAPFYLWDIAPESSRRVIVVFFELFIMFSMVVSQIVGMLLGRLMWIMSVLIATIPSALAILLLKFCRESPKHTLFFYESDSRTVSDLIWLKNDVNVNDTLEQIRLELNEMKLAPEMTLKNIWSKKLMLCLMGATSEQLCGVSVVSICCEILNDFGMSGEEPYYSTIGMGLCMLLGTMIALVSVGKWKPKALLLVSLALMFQLATSLTVVLWLNVGRSGHVEKLMFYMCLASLLLYGLAYGLGNASIRWLLILENFNYSSRTLAAALVLPVNFLISSVVVHTFLLIDFNMRHYFFAVSAFFDLVFFACIYFCMPND